MQNYLSVSNIKNISKMVFHSNYAKKKHNSIVNDLKIQLRNLEIVDIHNHLNYLNKVNNFTKLYSFFLGWDDLKNN